MWLPRVVISEGQMPDEANETQEKEKTGCSSDKTFGGDSVRRESFRDSSQDHEKIQCTLCYETMGYSLECLGAPQRS